MACTKQYQIRLRFLLFVMIFRVVCLSSYSLISTYYPQHIKKWPYNQQRASEFTGYVLSAFSPMNVIGGIVIGHFALTSYSGKFCLVTGLFLTGGAWIIFAALDYVTEWKYFLALSIALRLTIGLGVASVDISSFSLVIASYPDKIGFASGLMELTWSLGNMIGPPLGGILYEWMGFRMPAGIVGISLLFFSFVAIFVPTVNSSQPSYIIHQDFAVSMKQFLQKLFNLWTILSFVSAYLIMSSLSFPQATLSAFLHTKFNFSPRNVGLVFMVGGLINVLATPVVGKLCDAFHPRWFVPSGIIMAAGCGFFLMSFGHSIVLQYLAQAFIGFGIAFTFGSCYTDLCKELCRNLETEELDETTTGKLYSIFNLTIILGEMTGSIVGGVSADSLGFGQAAMIWGIIGTSFGVAYLLLFAVLRACL